MSEVKPTCPWCGAQVQSWRGNCCEWTCDSSSSFQEEDPPYQSWKCKAMLLAAAIERLKDELGRECEHGHLARSCELCERDVEITRLTAVIEEQRKQNEDWQQKLLSADAEIERRVAAARVGIVFGCDAAEEMNERYEGVLDIVEEDGREIHNLKDEIKRLTRERHAE